MSEDLYSRGDWIVHAFYGVGQIRGTEEKVLDGEAQRFFRVKTFDSDYWLPVDQSNVAHIRSLSSEYQIRKALSILRTVAEPLPADHKQRRLKIMKAVSDISLYSKARIIRDLSGRKKVGKLNITEAETLEKIKNQIINEWSVISNSDKETLILKLDKAMEKGIEKLMDGGEGSWLEKVRKGVIERRRTEKIN